MYNFMASKRILFRLALIIIVSLVYFVHASHTTARTPANDAATLSWSQETVNGRRTVLLQWLENDRTYRDPYIVQRRTSGQLNWDNIATVSPVNSADEMVDILGNDLTEILSTDLRQNESDPRLSNEAIYETLASNPDLMRSFSERYYQVGLAFGLAYLDDRAPNRDVEYYVARTDEGREARYYPVCAPYMHTIGAPTGLRESMVEEIHPDVGIRPSPRPHDADERYEWDRYQAARRVDGKMHLIWDLPQTQEPPRDLWQCVNSEANEIAGYHIYRKSSLTRFQWQLANQQTLGGSTMLVTAGIVPTQSHPDNENYLFVDNLKTAFPDNERIYTTWDYKVCPVDRLGNERACSQTFSGAVRELIPPQPATITDMTANHEQGQLSFMVNYSGGGSEISRPYSLFVTRSSSPSDQPSTWTEVEQLTFNLADPFALQVTDEPPVNGVYWYRVQVRDNAGNWSAPSAPIKGAVYDRTPPTFDPIPNSTDCEQNVMPLALTNLDPDARQVILYRRFHESEPWQLIKRIEITDPAQVILTDDYIPPYSVQVQYKVEVMDGHGNVSQPQTFCGTLDTGTPPGNLPNVTIEVSKDQNVPAIITWVDDSEDMVITIYDGDDVYTQTVPAGEDTYVTSQPGGSWNGYEFQYGNDNGVGPSTFLYHRVTNDFMNTNRQMTDMGEIYDIQWNIASNGRFSTTVYLTTSDCGSQCADLPLIALFRRVPDGNWMQTTPLKTPSFGPGLQWVMHDAGDISPDQDYDYMAMAFSPTSLEALGYWQITRLNAHTNVTIPPRINAPLPDAPTLPAGCVPQWHTNVAGLPQTISLPNDWYIQVATYGFQRQTAGCPDSTTHDIDADHIFGKGVLIGDGVSWNINFYDIGLNLETGQFINGRIHVLTSNHVINQPNRLPATLHEIAITPNDVQGSITIQLPPTLRAISNDFTQRSPKIAGVFSALTTQLAFDIAEITENIYLVDENLPWLLDSTHDSYMTMDAIYITEADLLNRFKNNALSNQINHNNLGLLQSMTRATDIRATAYADGLYAYAFNHEYFTYYTSMPGGIEIKATEGGWINIEESKVKDGRLPNAIALFTYFSKGTVTDHITLENGQPHFEGGHLINGAEGGITYIPGTETYPLILSPDGGDFELGAGGQMLSPLKQHNAGWPAFRINETKSTLYVPSALFDHTGNLPSVTAPAPAQAVWRQIPHETLIGAEYDPGVNIIHSRFNPINYDCYTPSGFEGDTDLYIRRGGVSESVVLYPTGLSRTNMYGYTETVEEFRAVFIDNALTEHEMSTILYLPYPSDEYFPLIVEEPDNNCPNGGTLNGVVNATHQYWLFQHSPQQWNYLPPKTKDYGDISKFPDKLFSLWGKATVNGITPRNQPDKVGIYHNHVSQWLPDGDIGQTILVAPSAGSNSTQSYQLGGAQYSLSGVNLSRFNAVPMNPNALPSTAGIDLSHTSSDLPVEVVGEDGLLTASDLQACQENHGTGCGFTIIDGNGAVEFFGEIVNNSPSTASIPTDNPVGQFPVANNSFNPLAMAQATIQPPTLNWAWPIGADYLDELIPVTYLYDADGVVLAGVFRDFHILPGVEIFRGDVSAVAELTRNGNSFDQTFGIFMGYSASQAALRALAMKSPDINNYQNWQEVEPHLTEWSEKFGYSIHAGDRNDPVDLAQDTWDNWGTDSYPEAHDVLSPIMRDLGGEESYGAESYTNGSITGLESGSLLAGMGATINSGMGQATFSQAGGDWRTDKVAFSGAVNFSAGGDNLFKADWIGLEVNRDREFIIRGDNVSSSLTGDYDVNADVILLIGTASGSERVEGGLTIDEINMQEMRFTNLGAVFGAGKFQGDTLFYIGAMGTGRWNGYALGGAILFGSVYPNSVVLQEAGFAELLAKLGGETISDGPSSTFTGAYLAVHGEFPIINAGCWLRVTAGGEFRAWYFQGNVAVYGGQVRGSVHGQFACILSARADLTLSIERLAQGGIAYPPGWSSISRECTATVCTAFSGVIWGATGFGFDCDPGSWKSWDTRWWGDSWCYTFGAAVGLTYINPPDSQGGWDFDYDIDFE